MDAKKTSKIFSPELGEGAVRMVLEHQGEHASQWAAMGSIAGKIGCTAETLRLWVRRAERDRDERNGPATEMRDRLKGLERENRELRRSSGRRQAGDRSRQATCRVGGWSAALTGLFATRDDGSNMPANVLVAGISTAR